MRALFFAYMIQCVQWKSYLWTNICISENRCNVEMQSGLMNQKCCVTMAMHEINDQASLSVHYYCTLMSAFASIKLFIWLLNILSILNCCNTPWCQSPIHWSMSLAKCTVQCTSASVVLLSTVMSLSKEQSLISFNQTAVYCSWWYL